MTLCQHGVQMGAAYECSACVTTPTGRDMCAGMPIPVGDSVPRCGYFAAHFPHPIGESLQLRGLDAASQALDEVLKLLGPPPGWRSAEKPNAGIDDARASVLTLRAYLDDVADRLLQHEAASIFEALGTVETYLGSER